MWPRLAWSLCVFQTVLKLVEILPQLPKFWDYSRVLLCPHLFGEFKGAKTGIVVLLVGKSFFFFSELVSISKLKEMSPILAVGCVLQVLDK